MWATRQVIRALFRMEAELEAGALATVDPKKTRVRVCLCGLGARVGGVVRNTI